MALGIEGFEEVKAFGSENVDIVAKSDGQQELLWNCAMRWKGMALGIKGLEEVKGFVPEKHDVVE